MAAVRRAGTRGCAVIHNQLENEGRHLVRRRKDGLRAGQWPDIGTGSAERLVTSPNRKYPWQFTPDGRFLIYLEFTPEAGFNNVTVLSMEGDRNSRVLLHSPFEELHPTLSPDGRWIVFTSERSGNPELWAMEVGSRGEPVRLTDHEALDDAADFSPDGRRLAFVSTREGNADIFVMPFAPGDATAKTGPICCVCSSANRTRRQRATRS
ncbi:MAG: PD40 domain-containing protein [Planctomycetes bacterium]|nr:PD40 domain-containing protein [Planctomycetota bacterium]